MDWAEFEKRLLDQLVTLRERVVFVIGPGESQQPYIQFAGLHAFGDNMHIVCGFQDDTLFDRKFTPQEEALFAECGFERLGEGPTYWQQDLAWPPTGQALAKVLKACMVRLRDVAAIASPDELMYKAWQHAGYGIGQYSEKWYPGGSNLSLSQLGLRKIES
ncbi:MAG: hypothetical protein Q4D96_02575 [Propionibacteriaceae bacterium]|nr:hypothetical protein [Propionibacteriaceae bacterium]